MSIKQWIVPEIDNKLVKSIADKSRLSYFLVALLNVRGIKTVDDIENFLNINNEYIPPEQFPDMDKLVDRVRQAIKKREKICVYGDYDADGITATALVYSYLYDKNAEVIYYIPDREGTGYGLNIKIIDKLKQQDVKLIFTVDNGVSAYDEIKYANSMGIDVVVTDHHRVPDILPEAVAIVNPYRKDCTIKYKNFAGVGVAFKAIVALEGGNSNTEELMKKYGDLLTIGTVGDAIELVGETRNQVKMGIEMMPKTKRLGLRIVLENMGLYNTIIDSGNISFGIVPRINASGRMGDANRAVRLLISTNYTEAQELYHEMDYENTLRKKIENEINDNVVEKIENKMLNIKHQRILVVDGDNWHGGVLGIVATRMTQKYGKPSLLITVNGENAKGSSRSIEGFSIYKAIYTCSQHLDRFGGHPMAAGINLKTSNIKFFKESILEYANSFNEMVLPKLNLDMKLNPTLISKKLVYEIDKLKPFGTGNDEPIFGIYGMKIKRIYAIGGGNHIKLILEKDGIYLKAIQFKQRVEEFLYNIDDSVDLAVTLQHNNFMQKDEISIFLVDIKLSDIDNSKVLRQKQIYENFKIHKKLTGKELELIIPTREDFVVVYKYLIANVTQVYHRIDLVSHKIKNKRINVGKLLVILDIMEDLDLIEIFWNGDIFNFKINRVEQKADLNSSDILKRLICERDDFYAGK